jgi:phage anti-repressor protein
MNPNIRILTIDISTDEGIGRQSNQINSKVHIPKQIDQDVLEEGNIFQIRQSSHEVVKTFNWDIDLLFIDSEHSYQDTKDNLKEWGKFVKPYHFIVCHDYTSEFPGVIQAVDEYIKDYTCRLVHTSSIAIIQKL